MNVTTEQVYAEFFHKLRAFIAKRVKNSSDVEDILQDVFIKINSNLLTLKDSTRLSSWLFQITRNTIIDFYRKKNNSIDFVEPSFFENMIDEDVNNTEDSREILNCVEPIIQILPDKYKEALLYIEYTNKSQKALSEKVGISQSGAKSRVQRARALLKKELLKCCLFEGKDIIQHKSDGCNLCK